jgi:phenylpropionate dioxygenase-like ring-hydroxylating dioxygenase large terminal subunit
VEYLRNTWYVGAWSADIAPGAILARKMLEEPIVFVRMQSGELSAFYDRCPHRFAPLSRGHVVGETLMCGYHGLRFNGAGACAHNPHGNKKIPPGAVVRTYPVAEKHSIVWIWMGDEAPRPGEIPDFSVLDTAKPEFVSKRDYIVMQAGYGIITDNLLDLSHVNILHEGLLGNEEANEAEIELDVQGEIVTVRRLSCDVPVPKVFDLSFRQDGKNVDLWSDMRWNAPACLLLDTGVTTPGAGRAAGTAVIGLHLLTPETASTTHYHFAAVRVNPPQRSLEDEIAIRDEVSKYRRLIFETQDAPMIAEQQQRILIATDDPQPALMAIDAGPVRAQRILRERIARERQTKREPASV